MSIQEKIIQYIRRNRVSTTEVADCLGKTGLLEGAHPVNRGHFRVGPVRWVYGYDESNWTLHEQVRDVQEGEVVVVETFNCKGRAAFGELVTKFVIFYRGAAAIASTAPMRDGNDLIKQNHPMWCNGITPIGTFNTKPERPMDPEIIADREKKYNGSIAVCDDSGVVIIPPDMVTEAFYDKLVFIERQEDIWFDCIDRLKWDTFDTVCLKKYLEKDV